ncbi:MAG: LamG domain-containing protein, partial [Balneolaceae bacterium]
MKSVLTTLSLFILLFIFTVISSSALAQDSLVAFYPFSGSAEDSSGFAHHGAVYGATLTEDRFGYPNSAYEFDGYSNYIDIGNFEELRITGDLTVSVWLKSASFENFSNAILTYQADNTDSDSTSNALYKINFIDSSKLRYAHESGHGENSTHDFSNVTFETETWYHLILVRNISEKIISVYVNGELADSSSFELLPNGGESSTLKIGENHGTVSPERFFNGVLDDIRIYNIVLPDSAIYDLYTERGWPLPQDSTEIPNDTLIAHFPFNGNAEDESGFDNDGIVHG